MEEALAAALVIGRRAHGSLGMGLFCVLFFVALFCVCVCVFLFVFSACLVCFGSLPSVSEAARARRGGRRAARRAQF